MAEATCSSDEEAALLSGPIRRSSELQHQHQHQQLHQRRRGCRRASAVIVSTLCLSLLISLIIWYPSYAGRLRSTHKAPTIFSKGLSANPLYFAAVGDWGRMGLYNQSQVAAQMDRMGEAQEYSFIISVGDNFYENGLSGVDDPLFEQSFLDVYTGKNLQKPWFVVLGNHDYYGDALAQLDSALVLRDPRWHCHREYQLLHQLEDGSYVEFFFIDTVPFVDEYWTHHSHVDWRGLLPREEHLAVKLLGLSQALESSVAAWKIVVGHHPVYSQGSHGDTVELIERVLPILDAHKADVYVNGHDHCLEHIKHPNSSVHFITTGGGSKAWNGVTPHNRNGLELYYDGQGFTTFTVTGTHLHISFYDIDGNAIHEVDLHK